MAQTLISCKRYRTIYQSTISKGKDRMENLYRVTVESTGWKTGKIRVQARNLEDLKTRLEDPSYLQSLSSEVDWSDNMDYYAIFPLSDFDITGVELLQEGKEFKVYVSRCVTYTGSVSVWATDEEGAIAEAHRKGGGEIDWNSDGPMGGGLIKEWRDGKFEIESYKEK